MYGGDFGYGDLSQVVEYHRRAKIVKTIDLRVSYRVLLSVTDGYPLSWY